MTQTQFFTPELDLDPLDGHVMRHSTMRGVTTGAIYGGAPAVADPWGNEFGLRFALWRSWDPDTKHLVVIGLNPSTATEDVDDPTIRRCRDYARRWEYGGLVMLNLFPLRSTDPNALYRPGGAQGVDENDHYLLWFTNPERAGLVLGAWGNHGGLQSRGVQVARMLKREGIQLHALSVTQGGHPGHPLYLRRDLHPQPYLVED